MSLAYHLTLAVDASLSAACATGAYLVVKRFAGERLPAAPTIAAVGTFLLLVAWRVLILNGG